ncbi:unnamed protein product, partial [Allacma fusca]
SHIKDMIKSRMGEKAEYFTNHVNDLQTNLRIIILDSII